jgi:hypothetical protein
MAVEFHPGELAVQQRCGTRDQAERVRAGIAVEVPPMIAAILTRQSLVVIGARDQAGRPWSSLLRGRPGFIRVVEPRRVALEAELEAGDPLRAGLGRGLDIGLLVPDFDTRERVRINGRLESSATGLCVRTEQVFLNCPRYIQRRVPDCAAPSAARRWWRGARPRELHRRLVARADTLFIASAHPTAGADVSHRGGRPGFVRWQPDGLSWPDYPGNSMFNTFGNLELDPRAGLLILDFEGGGTLQLTGRAWIEPAGSGDPRGRLVRFAIEELVAAENGLGGCWRLLEPFPGNPALEPLAGP